MTNEDIAAAVERRHAEAAVVAVSRRPSPRQSSHRLTEVDATLADGTVVPLILKRVDYDGVMPAARQVKPKHRHDSLREPSLYRWLEARPHLSAPALYAVDENGHRVSLLVARAGDVLLRETGDPQCWGDAARWAARLHAERDIPTTHLLSYGSEYVDACIARALAMVEDTVAAAAAASRAQIHTALTACGSGLIHGDYYASNILVSRDRELLPIDWEAAGIGPPALDIAALTSGSWSDTERAAMVASYVTARSLDRRSAVAFARSVSAARLVIALQWLAIAPDWRPPREHATNWLAEAHAAAADVGIRW